MRTRERDGEGASPGSRRDEPPARELEALLKGDKVELRNFGVLEVIERKGRIARNPKSKQEVFIPERKVVKFKPGKVMEDKITTPSMKGGIQPAPARKRENASEPPRVSGEGSLS